MKPCPHCNEQIPLAADSCPFCNEWLGESQAPAARKLAWAILAVIVLLVGGVGVAQLIADEGPAPKPAANYQPPVPPALDTRTASDGGPGQSCGARCLDRCGHDCRARSKKAVLNEICAKRCPEVCDETCR